MGRRILRELRPSLEEIERRTLLSAITDVMAGNSIAVGHQAESAARTAISSQSIANSNNQGPLLNPDGSINNQALAPTGTLTRRQQRKERFVAQYVGTYTVGAGVTSDQRIQTFITGAGSANTMLHSDIQLLLVTPIDTSFPIGGTSAIFDRNLNTNTVLGMDESAPQTSQYINRLGLPTLIPTVSIDVRYADRLIQPFACPPMSKCDATRSGNSPADQARQLPKPR